MAKRVSFLARTKTKKKISFIAGGRKVSFIAKVPSKRRKKVTFYATR
ncbi:MAG: hypothetical protein QXD72_00365 [Candidatus Aenigmatarchaeota archaeon]